MKVLFGVSWGAEIRSTLPCILCGPVVLDGLMFEKGFLTPVAVTVRSGIVGIGE